ncbi:MAG: hypothetical protein JWQ54_1504 [Mucilaginibacter sp.]|nr:hypothetical protein [Mucilaginibacter sp.]
MYPITLTGLYQAHSITDTSYLLLNHSSGLINLKD